MSLCQETPSDAIRQRADETSAVEARETGGNVIPAESFIARSRVGARA